MGSNDILEIGGKITGWSVLTGAVTKPATPVLPDIDPRYVRIERREEGSWESFTTKMSMTGASGKKTIYFVVGLGRVCGRKSGKEVCIDRPLEFFLPAGQSSAEHQWVSATMRTLSLAARGGFLVKALADLRQTTWDRGPVWYGKAKSGKPRQHESEVAAIVFAIQDELRRRGYLDENFEERSVDELAAKYGRVSPYRDELNIDSPSQVDEPKPQDGDQSAMRTVMGQPVVGICPDADCQGDMILRDGCPTCSSCSWSKC